MTNHIYIFSGLGADERVFQNMDFKGLNITFIRWIQPFKNETIENYATRLIQQIKTPNPIIIGLSFGGMIALEVAKQIKTKQVILIASAKTKFEIPLTYRIAGKLRLHKLIPMFLLRSSNVISQWFFGTKSPAEKAMLKEILKDTDPVFLRWAMNQIVSWGNIIYPKNTFHIHGDRDRILPVRHVNCDKIIQGSGHFMTVNRAEEVIEQIRNLFAEIKF